MSDASWAPDTPKPGHGTVPELPEKSTGKDVKNKSFADSLKSFVDSLKWAFETLDWHYVFEMYVKLVLEVFGAGGAMWGFSEVLTLRNDDNKEAWRVISLVTGVVFFTRYAVYCYQGFKGGRMYIVVHNKTTQAIVKAQAVWTNAIEAFGDKLSDEEIDQLFDEIDTDHGGTIDMAELTFALQQRGVDVNKKEVTEMVKVADADFSGALERNEFKAVLRPRGEISVIAPLGGNINQLQNRDKPAGTVLKSPSSAAARQPSASSDAGGQL